MYMKTNERKLLTQNIMALWFTGLHSKVNLRI